MRWVTPANLHITIWFLGEVREPRVEALTASLKEPLDARPFTLRVGGAGAFPSSGAPRAIWLGLVAGREGLLAVHEALGPRLMPLGFEPESRQFSPHLTIARVKDVRPPDAAAMRRALREATDEVGECEVLSATLFTSRPASTGSQYNALLPNTNRPLVSSHVPRRARAPLRQAVDVGELVVDLSADPRVEPVAERVHLHFDTIAEEQRVAEPAASSAVDPSCRQQHRRHRADQRLRRLESRCPTRSARCRPPCHASAWLYRGPHRCRARA